MRAILKRIVQAYQPMHLRGMMLDAPCQWSGGRPGESLGSPPDPRSRTLPAPADTHHYSPNAWSKS